MQPEEEVGGDEEDERHEAPHQPDAQAWRQEAAIGDEEEEVPGRPEEQPQTAGRRPRETLAIKDEEEEVREPLEESAGEGRPATVESAMAALRLGERKEEQDNQ